MLADDLPGGADVAADVDAEGAATPPADDPSALAAELLPLELALARRDPAGLEGGLAALLDERFEEVGVSGRRWDRASTVALVSAPRAEDIEIEGFGVVRLAEGVALATYVTVASGPDGRIARARRSSIWIRRGDRWRMRYHQGTRSDVA